MKLTSILYAAAALTLAASTPVMAEDSNDFQKQMMNQMMQQYKQQIQTGQKPLTASASPEMVNQGKAIFNDPATGTNGKSCGSCHSEGKKPLDGSNQADNYTAAYVQYCYEHALNGQKVIDKDKLSRLMAYFVSLRPKAAVTPSAAQTSKTLLPPLQQTPAPVPATTTAPAPKTEESW